MTAERILLGGAREWVCKRARGEVIDTVVCTYSLCTIPDDAGAVSEMRRVLRAGGKLLLAEHVRSPVGIVRAGQRVLEPLAVRNAADHLLREPLALVRAQGLVIEELERHTLGIVEFLAATKPADRG